MLRGCGVAGDADFELEVYGLRPSCLVSCLLSFVD